MSRTQVGMIAGTSSKQALQAQCHKDALALKTKQKAKALEQQKEREVFHHQAWYELVFVFPSPHPSLTPRASNLFLECSDFCRKVIQLDELGSKPREQEAKDKERALKKQLAKRRFRRWLRAFTDAEDRPAETARLTKEATIHVEELRTKDPDAVRVGLAAAHQQRAAFKATRDASISSGTATAAAAALAMKMAFGQLTTDEQMYMRVTDSQNWHGDGPAEKARLAKEELRKKDSAAVTAGLAKARQQRAVLKATRDKSIASGTAPEAAARAMQAAFVRLPDDEQMYMRVTDAEDQSKRKSKRKLVDLEIFSAVASAVSQGPHNMEEDFTWDVEAEGVLSVGGEIFSELPAAPAGSKWYGLCGCCRRSADFWSLLQLDFTWTSNSNSDSSIRKHFRNKHQGEAVELDGQPMLMTVTQLEEFLEDNKNKFSQSSRSRLIVAARRLPTATDEDEGAEVEYTMQSTFSQLPAVPTFGELSAAPTGSAWYGVCGSCFRSEDVLALYKLLTPLGDFYKSGMYYHFKRSHSGQTAELNGQPLLMTASEVEAWKEANKEKRQVRRRS